MNPTPNHRSPAADWLLIAGAFAAMVVVLVYCLWRASVTAERLALLDRRFDAQDQHMASQDHQGAERTRNQEAIFANQEKIFVNQEKILEAIKQMRQGR